VTSLRRHLSPALVISLVSLFASLGGVSYGVATGFIDSREIKNNTVRTRDLRNNDIRTRDLRNNEVRGLDIRNSTVRGRDVALNTLTGDDVDESRLEKVPSATAADSAASAQTAATAASAQTAASAASALTAGSAQTLNGLRVLPVRHRSGNVTGQTVLDADGLQLVVNCAGGDEDLLARTTVAGSEIAVVSDDAVAADASAAQLVHNLDDDFNPGEDFDLQDTVAPADDRIFQLHYLAGNGADVTAQLIADDDLGASNCVVSGYAVVVG
jgi:hypothetical protein